jgi:hypothetical protein
MKMYSLPRLFGVSDKDKSANDVEDNALPY